MVAERDSRPIGAPIQVHDVSRRFRDKLALNGVSLRVERGEIAALLGPNGAGKTTLLRILCGLLIPDGGTASILGVDVRENSRSLRQRVGLVPSGDRSFYLRISAFENLLFFARMHNLSRREAAARSYAVLEDVGLRGVERQPVGTYSHGMQKRLSVARALLMQPEVLLIDEATHDLDPEGARQIRDLVSALARRGSAIVWATQRLEEIRGFADRVTLLTRGTVRFLGTVPELMGHALPQRYLLRVGNGAFSGKDLEPALQLALGEIGTISAIQDAGAEDYVLSLRQDAVLGDALRSLLAAEANVQIFGCREEQSEIEDAFIRLTQIVEEPTR
jgi:ABC-2 type transport system ATP-binding protein